jgi:teichuronic acid biosynthesis glycosyltransferase TuaC
MGGRAPVRPPPPVTRDAALSPTRPISVLTFSTLYPNREMPYHGIFVENRLRSLLGSGEVKSMVVAPVPWFPFTDTPFGRYATFARVPREERRHDVTVLHPRYALLPKVGMSSAPFAMYWSLRNFVAKILSARFPFDLIDAHYFYPDGVAAVLLGRSLGKPVVITARGTDVNLIPDSGVARRLVRWAGAQAAGLITVSDALRHRLIELGVAGSRVEVLRNGVDLDLFAPQDRAAARRELGLDGAGPLVASVGWLIPRKGHDLVIRATAHAGSHARDRGRGPGSDCLATPSRRTWNE